MSGDRSFHFKNDITVKDMDNKIYASVAINPEKKGWLSKLWGSGGGGNPLHNFEGCISDSEKLVYRSILSENLGKGV